MITILVFFVIPCLAAAEVPCPDNKVTCPQVLWHQMQKFLGEVFYGTEFRAVVQLQNVRFSHTSKRVRRVQVEQPQSHGCIAHFV
ncbi:unnamed protein product [Larinioides sclopetarius]|uniref:Secreted protein n=1 Tax=Larinioides sclopetarius TaxID=280406 RepID=A0AAV2B573_9ARAC